MTDQKDKKKEPADWRPINLDEFNGGAKKISKIFKSDPKRIEGIEKDQNNKNEESQNN